LPYFLNIRDGFFPIGAPMSPNVAVDSGDHGGGIVL
jgi:hypothetical protein